MSAIPVICDRCRQTGIAGETDFSHLGDLLEFTPVPRKKERVDGWSPERQRAFIAALSATGSKRRAALAIGMRAYGVDQLLKAEGSDSFKAAFDRAMAIAKQNGSMKIAQGVADAAARNAQLTPPSRLRGLPPPAAEEEGSGGASEDEKWDLVEALGHKFMRKVVQERQARLNGEIVAADFYLRQITMMEVLFDLTATEFGFDPEQALMELRRGGQAPLQIVSTPFADWLDRSRRKYWLRSGEPERPEHPDPRYTKDEHKGPWGSRAIQGYSIALPMGVLGAGTPPAEGYTQDEWAKLTMDEQQAARRREAEANAEQQRAWEERAIAEHLAPLPTEGEGGARASAREGEGAEEGEQ